MQLDLNVETLLHWIKCTCSTPEYATFNCYTTLHCNKRHSTPCNSTATHLNVETLLYWIKCSCSTPECATFNCYTRLSCNKRRSPRWRATRLQHTSMRKNTLLACYSIIVGIILGVLHMHLIQYNLYWIRCA